MAAGYGPEATSEDPRRVADTTEDLRGVRGQDPTMEAVVVMAAVADTEATIGKSLTIALNRRRQVWRPRRRCRPWRLMSSGT